MGEVEHRPEPTVKEFLAFYRRRDGDYVTTADTVEYIKERWGITFPEGEPVTAAAIIESLAVKERHEAKLAELSTHCRALVDLMDYFDPPNLMAWKDDEQGSEWEVFIRRKGSDTQFGSKEWKT